MIIKDKLMLDSIGEIKEEIRCLNGEVNNLSSLIQENNLLLRSLLKQEQKWE